MARSPAEVEALGHGPTDNGRGRRRERKLEKPVQVQIIRRDDAVLRHRDEADRKEPLPFRV